MAMPIVFENEDVLECIFEHLPLQAIGQLGRCSKELRAVVARGLPLRKKRMAEIFRRLHVSKHVRLPEEHRISDRPGFQQMGAHECTLLEAGLKVDEDFPSQLFCYLEEVPAERVIASRNFITEGDVLRILDWLQHLPPQRRVVLELANHKIPMPKDVPAWGYYVGWVPASISAHPAVRSRGFRVDLRL